MRNRYGFLVIIALLGACAERERAAQRETVLCWMGQPLAHNRVMLQNADLLYLRGAAIVLPSTKCPGKRLQVINYPDQMRVVFGTAERKNTTTSIAYRATLIVEPVRIATPKVTEIRIVDVSSMTSLDSKAADEVARRIHVD